MKVFFIEYYLLYNYKENNRVLNNNKSPTDLLIGSKNKRDVDGAQNAKYASSDVHFTGKNKIL